MEISSSSSQPTSQNNKRKKNYSDTIIIGEDNERLQNDSRFKNFTVYPNKPIKNRITKELLSKLKENQNIKKEENINDEKENENDSSEDNQDIQIISEKKNQAKRKANSDFIIEIDEEKNNGDNANLNKEDDSKKKKKKRYKKKSQFLNGYTPFIFFEKEKFKIANFKEIKPNDYVRQISAEWKKMTDKEKEPYVRMALQFKIDFLSQQQQQQQEKRNFINQKRKREIEIEDEDSTSEQHPDNMNKYISNILVPFIEKSYKFFRGKGFIKSK